MGALEDYLREITSDNAMRKQAEVLRSIMPYPMGDIARNAYLMNVPKDYAPETVTSFRNDQPVNLPPQNMEQSPMPTRGDLIQRLPAPVQEPPAPAIPEGWNQAAAPQEKLAPETLAEMSPQERYAYAQGYTPPAVQAVAPVAQEPASPLIPERAQQPEPRRLQTNPAVNSAFEEMLKTAPKELQPMFRAIKQSSTERGAAMREAANQALQQIEQYRNAEHQSIKAGIDELTKTNPVQLQYGAVQHAIARDQALADKNAELAKAQIMVQGMDPTAAAEQLKQERERINEKYKSAVQEFDQTPQYKQAMEAKAAMRKEITDQTNLENQIEQLRGYIDEGKTEEAAKYARATVAQTVNSLRNQNAIQTTEMFIRYADLLDGQTRASLTNKWLTPDLWARLAQSVYSKGDADKVVGEIQKDPEGFKSILQKALSARPQEFLRSTIDTANANAASLNDTLTQYVIKPTSQKTAGIELFKPIPKYEPASAVRQGTLKSGQTFSYKPR